MFHQRIDSTANLAPGSGRIEGIEALRGLAAVAVVLCHTARHLDQAFGALLLRRLFEPGHSGVDLFFVLSGFIILLVHRRDVDRPDRLGRYTWRRLVRVWPLYWLALAITIAKTIVGGHVAPSAGEVVWNMALLPTTGEPILGIAWTLQFEAVFYLLFGLLLVDRRLGIAALGSWLALVIGGLTVGWQVSVATSAFALEFGLGMAAATLVRRGTVTQPARIAMTGGLLFAAAWIAEAARLLDGYGTLARMAYGVPAAMIVAGVAAWRPSVPQPLRTLGAASYAIYLFHLLGIGAAWQLLGRAGATMPSVGWFVTLATSGILSGLVSHRLVERPMLARLRR